MAKKNSKNGRKKGTAAKARPMRPRANRASLDAPGLAYAKLLADPCNSPIVHPTYSGSEGGYLFRSDSFVTFSTGAAETAGYLLFTPGAIGTTNSDICWSAGSASGTALVATSNASCPGKTFLQSNASTVRPVACCVKVTYPGAESTRSGRLHFGQVSGSLVDVGDSVSADSVAQALPHYTRIPADTIELLWKPNDADQLFIDPNATTLAGEKDRKSALGFAWAGIPGATGLTFHFTVVWEWQPLTGRGISNPTLSKSTSNNTIDDVVNYLIARGEKFVRGVGEHAAAGAMSAIFGIMPSLMRRVNPAIMSGN